MQGLFQIVDDNVTVSATTFHHKLYGFGSCLGFVDAVVGTAVSRMTTAEKNGIRTILGQSVYDDIGVDHA